MPAMPNRLPRRAVSGLREALEGEDEEHARDEIEQRDLAFADSSSLSTSPARSFFLNISSMRSVTRKPPKVLMATSATAMRRGWRRGRSGRLRRPGWRRRR